METAADGCGGGGNLGGNVDDTVCDECDIESFLASSIAAAMMLPTPPPRNRKARLRDGVDDAVDEEEENADDKLLQKRRRREERRQRRRRRHEEGEEEQRRRRQQRPLTADDHAFFLAAESEIAAGGSLSRDRELRRRRLAPRFAAERAAWWARAWASAAADADASTTAAEGTGAGGTKPASFLLHPRAMEAYAAIRSRRLRRMREELPRFWRMPEGRGGGPSDAKAATLDLGALVPSSYLPSSTARGTLPPVQPLPLRAPRSLQRLRHPLLPGGGGSKLLDFEGVVAAAEEATEAEAQGASPPLPPIHADGAAAELVERALEAEEEAAAAVEAAASVAAASTASAPRHPLPSAAVSVAAVADSAALVEFSGFEMPSPLSADPGWRVPVVVKEVVKEVAGGGVGGDGRRRRRLVAFIGEPLPSCSRRRLGERGQREGYHYDEDARRALERVSEESVVAAASPARVVPPGRREGEGGRVAGGPFYDLWRAPGSGEGIIVRWSAHGAVSDDDVAAGTAESARASLDGRRALARSLRPVSVAARAQFLGPLPEDAEEPAPHEAARLEARAALHPWSETVVAQVYAGGGGGGRGPGDVGVGGDGGGTRAPAAAAAAAALPRLLRVRPGPLPRPPGVSRALDLATGIARACCSLAKGAGGGRGSGEEAGGASGDVFFLLDRAAGSAEGTLLRAATADDDASRPPSSLPLPSSDATKEPGVLYDLWEAASVEGRTEGKVPPSARGATTAATVVDIAPPPAAPRAWIPSSSFGPLSHVPHTPPPARFQGGGEDERTSKNDKKKRKRKNRGDGGGDKKSSSSSGDKKRSKSRRSSAEEKRKRRQRAYLARFPLAALRSQAAGAPDLDADVSTPFAEAATAAATTAAIKTMATAVEGASGRGGDLPTAITTAGAVFAAAAEQGL